ncbi:uncharacterized protein PODANS_7_11640 [Podospora anserina S mat+]|uniref:Podospora anserina S mat+ genomic DNA chromosome 7, supercontig 1 n=1 Tax=Podospora anserina (strain S / ATCC MYA-4624 / DSM 980 / FGSC 10383) TaxID=515849 RepID=B2AXT4_PODAN|nr:uncharacterized protein PODANS_7_11640 [Podospora anserina S mat+]CAP69208.1 unnamed protein product [Podospora anserina S mat+]CDP32689.1 Putative protein of unknown function [Podospora anserina S mat+]
MLSESICLRIVPYSLLTHCAMSDFSDAGALLLAATSSSADLLAVNINFPSTYSALAASAILAHYGSNTPIGIRRPLTNVTFFDSWFFELGEYTSKVAYHWSGVVWAS